MALTSTLSLAHICFLLGFHWRTSPRLIVRQRQRRFARPVGLVDNGQFLIAEDVEIVVDVRRSLGLAVHRDAVSLGEFAVGVVDDVSLLITGEEEHLVSAVDEERVVGLGDRRPVRIDVVGVIDRRVVLLGDVEQRGLDPAVFLADLGRARRRSGGGTRSSPVVRVHRVLSDSLGPRDRRRGRGRSAGT